MSLTLADVCLGLGASQVSPALAQVSISRFVIDSRQAGHRACFLAFVGEKTDGHLYINNAIAQGAIAAIAQRVPEDLPPVQIYRPGQDPVPERVDVPILFLVDSTLAALQRLAAFWRARHDPTVIGITGSVGKTSTKELVAAVLRQQAATVWNEGNLNNEIGLPLTLLRLEPRHRYAVLEMGFYVEGEIAALCELAHPHIGVITNVGPIHLERAGSMEAIFRGKAELVRALPAEGMAVLNWDDDWVRRMADLSPAPIFRYGLGDEADLWADEIFSAGLEGIRFRFNYRRRPGHVETLHVHLPLLGRHSVHTALRAAAVGLILDYSWEDIIKGLMDVNAQLRIEVTPGPDGSTIIDDTYNASPPSTIAALNLLADMDGRHIAVLGDMLELGSYEETGHRLVGRRAVDVVDILITVGERARWIAAEARAAGMPAAHIHSVDTHEEALELLQRLIRPQDYILIKGSRAVGLEALVAALSIPAA
ncbi:MAG: UDP-N-acetylmuramoyl-tripeptide--D-alanyl-D-alanine ligase [Caldilineae bacterium]|nr:MAG: UDP-N-acetylmuramoyl-tripeptide--D-alanyl-D-alanine ligase [Caldilineae bacterium]